MDIFIVTCGIYSDYHIVGVFADKSAAKKIAKEIEGNVETWKINSDTTLHQDNRYSVTFSDVGTVLSVEKIQKISSSNGKAFKPIYWEIYNDADEVVIECYAKSEEHAVKIGSEVLADIKVQDYFRFRHQSDANFFSSEEIDSFLKIELEHNL